MKQMKTQNTKASATINTRKDIKKLQSNIIAMVRQILDLSPTPQEAAQVLEGLRQTTSSSEQKWHY